MDPKLIIQKIFNAFGYKINKTENLDPVMDKDKDFLEIYEKCREYTMTSREKMYSLYKSVRYIVKARLPGEIVECGVWRGGSAMLVAYTFVKLGETNRKIYLYDTFEGMTEPTQEDHYFRADKWKEEHIDGHSTWCYASLEEVKENMSKTKYPEKNLFYVKGKVEETIPTTLPGNISLLRLDTDWYESSKHELIHLYPLLVRNGVLIIDDYGLSHAGQRQAVDEYFQNKNILLNRVDEYGVIGTKTDN